MDLPTRRLQLLIRRFASFALQFDGSPESIRALHALVSSFDQSILKHFIPSQFSRIVSSVIAVKNSSSVLYKDVYQDNFCHVNAFGLTRAGIKIPMHDHPNQYAVMKVFQGSVRIRSFSIMPEEEEEDSSDRDSHSGSKQFVTTRYEQDIILSSKSDQHSAILGPQNGNIHEVVSLEPHTYFCDFFVPNSPLCHYYKPTSTDAIVPGQIVHMRRIRCPNDFNCHKMNFPSFDRLDQIE